MFKKIIAGYIAFFLAFFRFFALMAVCVGTGFLVVYPLWKLASSRPSLYSFICVTILVLLVGYVAAVRIRKAVRQNARQFLLSAGRKLTLLAGIIACIILVLNYERLIAALVLVLTFALYGYLAFGLSANSSRTPS